MAEAAIEVIVQRVDPQIDEKLSLSLDDLRSKLAGKKIFLREVQTIF
jgi:hypothetical protein